MLVELFWHFGQILVFRLVWVNGDSAQEIPFFANQSGNISDSRDECCFLCVWHSEYNGELGMVNPSLFPINSRLCGCKPWVFKDYFVFSQVK